MIKRILHIKANGEEIELTGKITFEQVQKLVGGYVEHVRILDHIDGRRIATDGGFVYSSMFVHDTGLIDGEPRNEKATELYQRNVRAQFPNSETPFVEAEKAMADKFGATMIRMPDPVPGYSEDPYIAGDVVYFEGYTCEEVDQYL